MIIKNNEQRTSINKSQTIIVNPIRKSQSIFLTTSNQNIMSFKEISSKQQQLNRVLNYNINYSQSVNTSMYSIECSTTKSKIRNRVNQGDFCSKFMQLDKEIIEVYSEFEKNYRSINQQDKLEHIQYQTNKYLEVNPKSIKQLIQTHDGLLQSDLMQGDQNHIKINRFKFNYFRKKLKGKVSPIHVFFNVPDRVQTSSLKTFISIKAEFPTKFNAGYIMHSRFAKIFSEKNQHYFSEEYLFITRYSDVDFEFSINFSFGNSQIIKSPIKQQHEPSELIQDIQPLIQKPQARDKILGNLSVTDYQQDTFSQIYEIIYHRSLKRKALMDVQEYDDNAQEITIFKCRCAINSFASIIRSKTIQRAEFVITKYMDRILLFLKILNKHKSTIQNFYHILYSYLHLKKVSSTQKLRRDYSEICFGNYSKKIQLIFFMIQEDKKKIISFLKNNKSVMNQVNNEYNKKQRILWIEYIKYTYLFKDQKKKIHETALNFKEPKIYDLPNRNELSLLIEQYAKLKKLL